LRYYILTALYCLGIFYLSSRTEPAPIEIPLPAVDKLAHTLVYAGLCALISIGIHRSDRGVPLMVHVLAPIAFTVFYGVTDEVHQLYVPNRSFELADLAADTAGALLAQAALFLWWRRETGE
jgi:VanZ family protein